MSKEYELFMVGVGEVTNGHAMDSLLREKGLLERCNIEERLLQSWFGHPETYPDELKTLLVYIWSWRDAGLPAALCWVDGKLEARGRELWNFWSPTSHAVLLSPQPV